MKMPHQITKEFPIPDFSAAVDAIFDSELKPKRSVNSSYAVFLVGLTAINISIFTNPSGEQTPGSLISWAVLLLTFTVVMLMMSFALRKAKKICNKLEHCYNSYLSNPCHTEKDWLIEAYYDCLNEIKYLHDERERLISCTKFYHRHNQWLSHINKSWPTVVNCDLYHTDRGKKLQTYGFYTFYDYWQIKNQSLLALYKANLTIEEIKIFLNIKRNLTATFYYDPKPAELAEEVYSFNLIAAEEEAAAVEAMEEHYELMVENRKERYALYLSFKDEYHQLAKEFNLTLPPFN
jgi:hypothetical protein